MLGITASLFAMYTSEEDFPWNSQEFILHLYNIKVTEMRFMLHIGVVNACSSLTIQQLMGLGKP